MSTESENRIPFEPQFTVEEKEICNSSKSEIILFYLNYPSCFFEDAKDFTINTWLEILFYFLTFAVIWYIYYCSIIYFIKLVIDYFN
tara:strand:+ start:29 stop:289 length:261 start_codon:yes stop_codon:yes gene_type:complete